MKVGNGLQNRRKNGKNSYSGRLLLDYNKRVIMKRWKKLYGLQATFICPYCLNEFSLKKATVDHIIPKSRGGSSESYNLVWACKRCNNEKGALTPEEYKTWKTTIDNEVWKRLEKIRNGGQYDRT